MSKVPIPPESRNSKPSLAMMKEVQLFKAFQESELQQLINLGETAFYEAETNVVIEAEPSWGLYIILQGSVGVLKTNKLNGALFEVGQLSAGSFFGEMSFLDENPRSATVKTLTDSQLFHLSKERFTQVVTSSTDIQIRFLSASTKALVNRLRELDDNYVISQYQLWKSILQKELGTK